MLFVGLLVILFGMLLLAISLRSGTNAEDKQNVSRKNCLRHDEEDSEF